MQQQVQPISPAIAVALECAGSKTGLSRAININDRTIRRWLDGSFRPSRNTAQQILDYLAEHSITEFTLKDFYK